jgi:hypothetical protein
MWNYAVKESNFSPYAVTINGKTAQFMYEKDKYRFGLAGRRPSDLAPTSSLTLQDPVD